MSRPNDRDLGLRARRAARELRHRTRSDIIPKPYTYATAIADHGIADLLDILASVVQKGGGE